LVDKFWPQQLFSTAQGTGNQLPGIVIDYQRHIANGLFKKGFEI